MARPTISQRQKRIAACLWSVFWLAMAGAKIALPANAEGPQRSPSAALTAFAAPSLQPSP